MYDWQDFFFFPFYLYVCLHLYIWYPAEKWNNHMATEGLQRNPEGHILTAMAVNTAIALSLSFRNWLYGRKEK